MREITGPCRVACGPPFRQRRCSVPLDRLRTRPPATGGLLCLQSALARRVARGVFRIAGRAVGGALRLIHLAFGLHLFVTRHLAGRVLDGALDLSAAPLTCSRSIIGSSQSRSWPNAEYCLSFPSHRQSRCSHQPAMVRTHSRASAMLSTPGNSPRNSTTAESSPRWL